MIRTLALSSLVMLAACSDSGGQDRAADPVALVSLGTAQEGSVQENATLYGTVERGAEAQYTLAAPAEAHVVRVASPAGTLVRRGQLVVALSPSPATRAQLTSARSSYRAAQDALARAQRLRADGLASDADVESAHQAAQSARATQLSMMRQAGDLALRAPGAGYVQTVAVNPGDLVSTGTTVATISRLGTLRARFGIDPAAAAKLPAGEALRVRSSDGGAPFSAKILSVDPSIDPQTRLASVYIRVPAGQGLGPGQALVAAAPVSSSGRTVTIPYEALLDDGGQPFVYVVKGGVAHRRDVETGATGGNRVAVIKGVSPGDKVVTAGGTGIEDGMKVRTR